MCPTQIRGFIMNKIMLILTVAFLSICAYAQNNTKNEYDEWKPSRDEYTNFDIGKYTTPDIVRNQLDINVDFRSVNTRTDYSSQDRDVEYERSSIYGNVSSFFSRYVNTRKRISNLTGNLSLGEEYFSRKDKQTFKFYNSNIIDNESSSLQQNSLNLTWSNKWYFSKLIYLDYGIRSYVSYISTHNKTKNQAEEDNEKQKAFSFSLSPQLGVGYGRIENVQDARQAVYIANALSKKMVLARNLSDDELFELSQIASTVKNKRFLDSRLHLIEEITKLDSFFVSNNLLADNGAAYFTTLNDMWLYGDLFSRQSGYELSFLVRPYFDYQDRKYTPVTIDNNSTIKQYIASLNFNYEKPFKLNWQHSLTSEIFGDIYSSSVQNKETNNNYKNSTEYKAFGALAYYSLGYFPNTRTNIQVATSQRIQKVRYDDEQNAIHFLSTLNANLYYYFSPNLRLTGNCELRYSPNRVKGNEGNYSNEHAFSSYFNVRLTYFIF